jgi:hypothetical protein
MLDREIANPKYHFNLGSWGCGTQACAIGLAIATKEFANEGFRRYPDGFGYVPVYQNDTSWSAIMGLFGINEYEALRFFQSTSYPSDLRVGPDSARAVSKRIRDYVATHPLNSVADLATKKVLEPA